MPCNSRSHHKSLVVFVFIGLRLAAGTTIDIDAELKKTWPDKRAVNVVFHGHSLPSGYHLTHRVKPFESYPLLLRIKMAEQYLNAVFNTITTAIGGENSVAEAARFESDVLPFKPDLILIDSALNERPLPLAEVEAAWPGIIDSAKAANIPLIFITPTVPGAFIANPRMIRDGDTINFHLSGRKDFQYALITSTTLRTSSWSQRDRIGPLEIDREIVLSDPGPLPDQRFYRIAITEPNQP